MNSVDKDQAHMKIPSLACQLIHSSDYYCLESEDPCSKFEPVGRRGRMGSFFAVVWRLEHKLCNSKQSSHAQVK